MYWLNANKESKDCNVNVWQVRNAEQKALIDCQCNGKQRKTGEWLLIGGDRMPKYKLTWTGAWDRKKILVENLVNVNKVWNLVNSNIPMLIS